jgi:hypothetical protein
MEKNEVIVPELNKETIESMIYIIRGQKVMLDFELAKIYGYSTKAYNQQVKIILINSRKGIDFNYRKRKRY